jgi:hypothetical protein
VGIKRKGERGSTLIFTTGKTLFYAVLNIFACFNVVLAFPCSYSHITEDKEEMNGSS